MDKKKNVSIGYLMIFLYMTPLCIYLQTAFFVRNNNYTLTYILFTITTCLLTAKWNFSVLPRRLLTILFLISMAISAAFGGALLYVFQTTLMIVLVLLRIGNKDVDLCLKYIRTFGMIIAFSCYLQFFVNSFYMNIASAFFNTQSFETISRLYRWDRSTCGLMPQTSHAAGIILYSFYVEAFKDNKNRGIKKWLILTVLLGALLLTNKRAHFLFGMIAWLVTLLTTEERSKRGKHILIGVLVAIVIVTIIYNILPYLNPNSTISSIVFAVQNLNNGDVDVTSGRIFLVQEAVELIKRNPIQGNGWGAFKKASFFNTDAHNVYLQLWAEGGFFVFALFILEIISYLKASFGLVSNMKTIKDETGSNYNNIKVAIAIQIFFSIYCLTGNCLYNIDFWAMYLFATVVIDSTYVSSLITYD